MKKNIVLLSLLALAVLPVFAGPFGLKMGMTLEEIAEQCEEFPRHVMNDVYQIMPKKRHPLFIDYVAFISESKGLYEVRAVTEKIETNKFGTELQDAFHNVKDRISKTYGSPKIKDGLNPNTTSSSQRDERWFYTLREGERELVACWSIDVALEDGLDMVILECCGDSGLSGLYGDILHNVFSMLGRDGGLYGYLQLYYYFQNANTVEDEQDSVF
ncbi:MAG: hypothetical protein IJR50_01830 [Treponema sp.]|nr:hypothetical protein [Treponema sp.]